LHHGLAAWAYDPRDATATSAQSNGVVYLSRFLADFEAVISRVFWSVSNAGVGPVAGQNEIAVQNAAGDRLSVANIDGVITSTGVKETVIPAMLVKPGVWYSVAWLFNAATPPSLSRCSSVNSAALYNINQPNTEARGGTIGAGLTAIPSSLNLGIVTPTANQIWCAVK
jgi:hypothetical protein